MNRRILSLFITIIIIAMLTGCQKAQKLEPDYSRALPPGQLALRKIIDPAQFPDFTIAACELSNLRSSIQNSINYMNKPSSQQFFPYGNITHDHAKNSLQAFAELLDSGIVGRQLNAAIQEKFDIYISVGCDDMGTILYTGYYTPIFDGSMTPTEKFKYPLYTQPDDLVKDANGNILGRKMPDGSLTQYPPRTQIESSGILKGKELLYLSDPFEVYIAHVQGSAKIRFPDGSLKTIGYTANNGHEYHSIAQKLVDEGKIQKNRISLSTMIEYFKANPDKTEYYINQNPRFVFFQTTDGPPHGSLNEPVTPYRTIATDKSIYPRASLAFVSSPLPRITAGQITKTQFTGFVLDQDTGGAIRAPGRCDVYMGIGDAAGKLAGHTYQEGKLYYLFLKQPGLGF